MRALFRHKLSKALVLALILTALVTAWASAQVSSGFDLSWNVLSGGGGARASANYAIEDSMGQFAPGFSQFATSQGERQVAAGFHGPDLLSFILRLPVVTR